MKTPRGISALGTFLFFVIFLVALGVLWVSTGGPSRSISHSSPFLKPPYSPGVNLDGKTTTGGSIEADTDTDITPPDATEGGSLLDYFFNFRGGSTGGSKPTSPYAADIQLSAGNADSSDPENEYVIISTSRKLAKTITITGWTLESKTFAIRAPIGSAAQIPVMGQIQNDIPITIGPDSEVFITTGRSPNGGSFRVNMCTGYFEQFQDYAPRLDKACLDPQEEALKNPQKTAGNVECIDFMDNLRSCELYTDDIPSGVGSSCRDFIQNDLSYNGCVTAHRNDPDFYRNEWRIFLNRQQELWVNTHDQIRLLDENGQLIASVTY